MAKAKKKKKKRTIKTSLSSDEFRLEQAALEACVAALRHLRHPGRRRTLKWLGSWIREEAKPGSLSS